MMSNKNESKNKRTWREYVKEPCYIGRLKLLTGNQKRVLVHILDRLGKNFVAWPSQRLLAGDCGLDKYTVNKAIARLVFLEFLVITQVGTGRSSSYSPGTTLKLVKDLWTNMANMTYQKEYDNAVAKALKVVIKNLSSKSNKSVREARTNSVREARTQRTCSAYTSVREARTKRIPGTKTIERKKEMNVEDRTKRLRRLSELPPRFLEASQEKPLLHPEELLSQIQSRAKYTLRLPAKRSGLRQVLAVLNRLVQEAAKIDFRASYGSSCGFDDCRMRIAVLEVLDRLVHDNPQKLTHLQDLLEPDLWKQLYPGLFQDDSTEPACKVVITEEKVGPADPDKRVTELTAEELIAQVHEDRMIEDRMILRMSSCRETA